MAARTAAGKSRGRRDTLAVMGTSSRALAALMASALLLGGCFAYNKSGKRWAYVGDTVLVLGGGGIIAADLLTKDKGCMETATMQCGYEPPFSGALVAGAVLVASGIFGYIFNATRDNVKTSR
jgi:hypothetical protein